MGIGPLTRPCLAPIVAALVGCASGLEKVPETEAIAIRVADDAEPKLTVGIANRAANETSWFGGAAGGAGGLALAAGCGPFVLLCALVTVPAGAVGGLGLTHAGISGLTSDERRQLLRGKIDAYLASGNSHERLVSLVTAIAEPARKVSPTAPRVLSLELNSPIIEAIGGGDHVALKVRARAALKTIYADGGSSIRIQLFQYRTPESDVALWIADDETFLRKSFDEAYTAIARALLEALSGRAEPVARTE